MRLKTQQINACNESSDWLSKIYNGNLLFNPFVINLFSPSVVGNYSIVLLQRNMVFYSTECLILHYYDDIYILILF